MNRKNKLVMILVVMVLMAVCSLGYAGKVQASGFQAKKASSNTRNILLIKTPIVFRFEKIIGFSPRMMSFS